MHDAQLELMGTFATAKPPHPIFCHEQFLEKLANESRSAVGRRAAFLLQRLIIDAARLHYKPTNGVNRGWRRSPLGEAIRAVTFMRGGRLRARRP